jgi:hypothetical protein
MYNTGGFFIAQLLAVERKNSLLHSDRSAVFSFALHKKISVEAKTSTDGHAFTFDNGM